MNEFAFSLRNAQLCALPSGGLWWAAESLLVVSDLHLGKSERMARRGGAMLPPYEIAETLSRLEAEIERCGARTVLCLGDSFDDIETAGQLSEKDSVWLTRLMGGREWIWIEGNHDPGPTEIGGTHLAHYRRGPLTFRHIARPRGQQGEISGHYHPKARFSGVAAPCFLVDANRVIMPAFGTYTGGLRCSDPVFSPLLQESALAVLTGRAARAVPMQLAG